MKKTVSFLVPGGETSRQFLDMQVCYVTNQGLFRQTNEDALRVGLTVVAGSTMEEPVCAPFDPTREFWIAVADGMGGHPGGEIASSAVVQELGDPQNLLSNEDGIRSIPGRLIDRMRESVLRGAPQEMGTTLSGLCFSRTVLYLLHIGDSRIYSLSPFARLTRDDTHVEDLIDQGLLSEEMRNLHPSKNLLTKALIADRPAPAAMVRKLPLPTRSGGLFLLCTDGLWENFQESELEQICSQAPGVAAFQLLETAMERGARDNVTFILVSN